MAEDMILIPKKDLKLFIELNPEMYDDEIHCDLFTETEKSNLSQALREPS